jgi:glycosyltransferase involved in cell wall biosynthesis
MAQTVAPSDERPLHGAVTGDLHARVPVADLHTDTVVVVPVYNEADVLANTLQELRRSFTNIIAVDDGSSDSSADIARSMGVTVVQHHANLGAGAAMQTGMRFALIKFPHAEQFVTFDADGQHRVADAVKLVDVIRRGEADVVMGTRFRSSQPEMPRGRRLLLRTATMFTRLSTGLAVSDTHNGLRVLSRTTAEQLRIELHGMAHGSEILHQFARLHVRIAEVPVTVHYTEYSMRKGQSSINAINILFDLLTHRIRVAR